MEDVYVVQCKCPHCDHMDKLINFTYVDDVPTFGEIMEYRGIGIDVLATCPNCKKTFTINLDAYVDVYARTYKEVPQHVTEKDTLTIRF